MIELIKQSILNAKGQHVVSAATISAGATGKVIEPETLTLWAEFMEFASDSAILSGLAFTLYLFYREYRKNELDKINLQLARIKLAREDHREEL